MTNKVDVKLLTRNGTPSTYTNVETITIPTPDDLSVEKFTAGEPLDNSQVSLDFSGGVSQQYVEPPSGYVWRGIDIEKPATLISENIADGVNIAGIPGTHKDRLWELVEGTVSGSLYSTLSSLRSYAFYGASNITGISLPNCTTIGASAFQGCVNLSDINIPQLNTIGNFAFSNCTLMSVSFPSYSNLTGFALTYATVYNLYGVFPNLNTVSDDFTFYYANIYDTVFEQSKVVGFPFRYVRATNCSFSGFDNLTSSNGTGTYAIFDNCTFPSFVNLSSGMFTGATFMNMPLDLTYISGLYSANFYRCAFNNVVIIGSSALAFSNQTMSTDMYFHHVTFSGQVSVNGYGYNGCRFINCRFPDLVEGDFYTFISPRNYYSGTIFLPKRTTIKVNEFISMSNITAVYLSSCSSILNYAFRYCSKLSSLYINSTSVPVISSYAFRDTTFTNSIYLGYYGSVYVPISDVSSYRTAQFWSAISSRIVGLTPEEFSAAEALF